MFGTSIPIPDTSVRSVRHGYRYRTLRQVRYDSNTGTRHFGKFGTTSMPVPDTSASSVRHQYRYRTLRQVRYDISTGTENTGTVPNTPLKTYVFKAVCDPSTARYYVPGTGLHDVMKDIRSGIRLVDTCYTLLLRVHLHIF